MRTNNNVDKNCFELLFIFLQTQQKREANKKKRFVDESEKQDNDRDIDEEEEDELESSQEKTVKFCFQAQAWTECVDVVIELKEVFRY